jgi:hypothetical protein
MPLAVAIKWAFRPYSFDANQEPEAAERRHDFVRDHEDAVTAADLADGLPIAVRGDDDAADG